MRLMALIDNCFIPLVTIKEETNIQQATRGYATWRKANPKKTVSEKPDKT